MPMQPMQRTVREFFNQHADAAAADEFAACVERRLEERAQESRLPVDEELRSRVAALEDQLVALSGQVREQRDAVPRWAVQRLEESQAGALSQLLALGDVPDEELLSGTSGGESAQVAAGSSTALTAATALAALNCELAQLSAERPLWAEAQQRMGDSAAGVQAALDGASLAQQQLAAAKSLPVSSVDAAV